MKGLQPDKPPVDTDDDGLPDAWEKARGLDPRDAGDAVQVVSQDDSADDGHKGYTYIEYYINGLADQLVTQALREIRR